MNRYPGIFTQVLGPVGPGPSSSSTCGMLRTAYLAYQIFGEIPSRARILLPNDGVFGPTWYGMRSDLAVLNGLLGRYPADSRFMRAYKDAANEGLEFSYELIVWNEFSTTQSKTQIYGMELSANDGRTSKIVCDSTGGGTCLIREIEGCPVDIHGDQYEYLLFYNFESDVEVLKTAVNDVQVKLKNINDIAFSRCTSEKDISSGTPLGTAYLINIRSSEMLDREQVETEFPKAGLMYLREIKPVHAVTVQSGNVPPFEKEEELILYCEKKDVSLWQAALDYESALSGWSEKEVLEYATELYDVICEATDKGLKGSFDMNGIATPKAYKVKEHIGDKICPDLGVLKTAIPAALGVMEYSNSSGTIVYLPTGGSSGIVPGVLRGLRDYYKAERSELVKALLVCGLIGILMSEDNHFSGVQYGCQAEIACAAAMASGAVIHFMNGTAKQACDAASMCLQSMMGLMCDTVAGMVQVPCLARNITGTSIAYSCAVSVMAGFDPVVPLKDSFWALKHIGRKLAEIGICGACDSETGRRLAEEQKLRDREIRREV